MPKHRTFLIIGLGTFGFQAAVALAEGGATVIAIDRNRERIEHLAHQVAKAVCVDATDEEALESIGAFDAEVAIVALGGFFDSSVLVTHLLHRRRMREIVVQVDSQRQGEAIRAVGATAVAFPERDTAHALAHQHLVDPLPFERIAIGADAALAEIPVSRGMVGRTLRDLDLRKRYHVAVVAVKTPPQEEGRADHVSVAPDADVPLVENQILMVLGHHHHLARFHERLDEVG